MKSFIKNLLRAIAGALVLFTIVMIVNLLASYALMFDTTILLFFIGVIGISIIVIIGIYYIDTTILKDVKE